MKDITKLLNLKIELLEKKIELLSLAGAIMVEDTKGDISKETLRIQRMAQVIEMIERVDTSLMDTCRLIKTVSTLDNLRK